MNGQNADREHPGQAEELSALREENRALRENLAARELFIRSALGRFLTNEVLEALMREKETLSIAGELRYVTMLFSDIRGSTDLSERMAPMDFIRMLNHYLEEMIEIVNAWRGNILEFVGDAIVAVYGAPRENADAAEEAVACAVAMQRRMEAVNEWNRSQGYPIIGVGIGIHTGEAVLGTIGSATRAKYDMIGRNVNLAERIESLSGGGQILVSTETLSSAGDRVRINPAGERCFLPKGIHKEILVHDVIGYGNSLTPRGAALSMETGTDKSVSG
ncbi:MAG: adenylate/guanylate cyclase domain-containing protein [Clostridiales bacterium]|nr:adenylate/guanylate cyclase domain-containing protein [Clostridiales bacterium]